MGKNITEKILAKASGKKEVSPGEYVFVTSPCPVPGIGRVKSKFEAFGAEKVFDPKLAIVLDDHAGDAGWSAFGTEDERASVWRWAKELGIPRSNIFVNKGIGHIVSAELCWALPGTVYLSITNGHSTTLGGLGSLALNLSYDSLAYLITGRTWLRVPETIRFNISGGLQEGVMPRDISDFILGEIGPAGAPYEVIEWTGPVIDNMSMDGRFSICNDPVHCGAKTAIINPDKKTVEYVKERTREPFEPLVSDPDAIFARTYNFDVSDLEPQVVEPPRRWTVKPVKKFTDIKINRAFIGSCFNSRLDDLRIAAKILRGKKIHPEVRLNITPGSVNVLKEAMREGLIETFLDAECEIPLPCCGMCGGANTPLSSGDTCLATGTSNYTGRMGHRNASIYLANPATVAASAIEGRITDPREYL
jgi:homoaconitase/3-isopropylmalate dehydratase large subunit